MRVPSRLTHGLSFTAALSAFVVCGGLRASQADALGNFHEAYDPRASVQSIGATGLALLGIVPPGM